jgi:hypothetical protein
LSDEPYSDSELDAAVDALSDPARLTEAQDVVMRAAPALQRVLAEALQEGGWFDAAHDQAVREAATRDDPGDRVRDVRTLVAEETRIGMLVGVAVGFELARELGRTPGAPGAPDQAMGAAGARDHTMGAPGAPNQAKGAAGAAEHINQQED